MAAHLKMTEIPKTMNEHEIKLFGRFADRVERAVRELGLLGDHLRNEKDGDGLKILIDVLKILEGAEEYRQEEIT